MMGFANNTHMSPIRGSRRPRPIVRCIPGQVYLCSRLSLTWFVYWRPRGHPWAYYVLEKPVRASICVFLHLCAKVFPICTMYGVLFNLFVATSQARETVVWLRSEWRPKRFFLLLWWTRSLALDELDVRLTSLCGRYPFGSSSQLTLGTFEGRFDRPGYSQTRRLQRQAWLQTRELT